MRAECDAILIGSGTLLDDDPSLTCRLPGLAKTSPSRIVLGNGAAIPAGLKVFAADGVESWLVTTVDRPPTTLVRKAASDVINVSAVGGRPWLPAVMEELVARGITRLLVEGGPTIWQAFDRAALVDEVVMFKARSQSDEVGSVSHREALTKYVSRTPMQLVRRTRVGNDDMFEFRRRIAGHEYDELSNAAN